MKMKTMIRVLVLVIVLFAGSSIAFGQQSAPASGAGITRLVITRRQIVFGGASFGSAGPYEVIGGIAYGELDPHVPGNTGIVNLNRAPVNANGRVEYST